MKSVKQALVFVYLKNKNDYVFNCYQLINFVMLLYFSGNLHTSTNGCYRLDKYSFP